MNKKRVLEIYNFLANASMKRMNDDEKIQFIRLLRQMKPAAKEMQEAVNDAVMKAQQESVKDFADFVGKAVSDIANEDTDISINVMTADTFKHLCFSNDWTFNQVDELEELLVKK